MRRTGGWKTCAGSTRSCSTSWPRPARWRRSSSSRSRAKAGTSFRRRASSQGLRRICDEHGILLIADEIQTGAGRTGKMWAVEHWGVEPDILLTAKGIASGMPLGAMVARAELLESWGPGAHGSTYGGNPVACAAALATIELLEGGLVDNAATRGDAGARRPASADRPGSRPRQRRAREGPHARSRVRHRRARRRGPVGRLPERPARARVRQDQRSDVTAADRQRSRDGDGACGSSASRSPPSRASMARSSSRSWRPVRCTRSRPPADWFIDARGWRGADLERAPEGDGPPSPAWGAAAPRGDGTAAPDAGVGVSRVTWRSLPYIYTGCLVSICGMASGAATGSA